MDDQKRLERLQKRLERILRHKIRRSQLAEKITAARTKRADEKARRKAEKPAKEKQPKP